MWLNLFLYIIFAYSFLARILRWLSLWQQKEYRLDRFYAYLRTSEGKLQLRKLVDFPLKKSQLRRPHLTYKALIILTITIFLILFNLRDNFFILGAMYMFAPLIIMIATVPVYFLTLLWLNQAQSRARNLIKTANPLIVGVSGSYGKTSTKILISQILSTKYSVWTSPKSHNTPISIAQALNSTYKGENVIVLEYAAYKIGEISSLYRNYPATIGVFTGLNSQHLSLFGSWENMLSAETELFSALPDGSTVFYNDYDDDVKQEIKKFNNLKLKPVSRIEINNPQLNDDGQLSFTLGNKKNNIKTKLLGQHYLVNVAQAINLAIEMKISHRQISDALSNFKPGPEFINQLSKQGIRIIVDDRTSNPDGFLAAIDLCSHKKADNKWLITSGIIDLGEKEAEIHQQLAIKSRNVFAGLIHTSIVGQKEFSYVYIKDYHHVADLKNFKQLASRLFKPGDLILIEGKIPNDIQKYII